MIGKIGRAGRGFAGTINYLLDGSSGKGPSPHRVTWTETRNLFDPNPRHAARYMRAIANTSGRIQKPVYHFIISWMPAEAPPPTVMSEIADAACQALGLADHQCLYVAHHDAKNPHVHIVANRVHPTRHTAWKASHDYRRLERILARLSEIHGFAFVPGRHNQPNRQPHPLRRPKSSSVQMAKRQKTAARPEWTATYARVARQQLIPHFQLAIDWNDLEQRLFGHRITLMTKGQGLVLLDTVGEMKLSSLGRGIRLSALETKFAQTWKSFNDKRIPTQQPTQPVPSETTLPRQPEPSPTPSAIRKRQSM